MIIFLIVMSVVNIGITGVEIYEEERKFKQKLLNHDVYEDI